MQKRKKAMQSLRLLFSAALFISSLSPAVVHAEENTSYGDIDGDPIVSITDLDVSRVEEAETETGGTSLTPAGDIEFINVIIELDEPCVLDKGLVPGSPEAKAWSDHLVSAQNQIAASAEKEMNVSEVNRIAPEENSQTEHFTNVVNGMTMRIPAGMISMIKSIGGVKRVFEEATYSAPKTEQNEIEPMVNAVSDLIGTGSAYTGSYHGEGMVIGVLDTSLDVAHSAFSSEPENPRISEEDFFEGIRAENAYVSSKIPFAYDYFDYDSDVVPEQNNENAIHGTHVSSIAAGKDHMITGIAPEAQIAFFKVFPDYEGSSSDSILIRALEDAVIVKPDVLNISLGTDGGSDGTHKTEEFESEVLTLNEIYQRVYDAGIPVVVAAGNAGYMGATLGAGEVTGLPPHFGTVGSPSTYSAPLSVGNVYNSHSVFCYLMAGYQNAWIPFNDPNWKTDKQFDSLENPEMPEYADCGYGRPEDFENVETEGLIALVSAGEIPVAEKQANAAAAGAVGMIVYNNTKGSVANMVIDHDSIPCISVKKDDGEAMKAMSEKVIHMISEGGENDLSDLAGQVSDVSAWGTDDNLHIKPEVCGVGEGVFAAVPGGYQTFSGTSMAAPTVTAAAALVRAYVKDAGYAEDVNEIDDLAIRLLMSTAKPITTRDESGFESPRHAGAGLINVSDAMAAHAYLSVEGTAGNRPKIELGDDPDHTGVYPMNFTVTNISDFDQNYQISVYTAGLENEGEYTLAPVSLDAVTTAPETISVPAHSSTEVSFTVSLTDEGRATVEELHGGDDFVEGYVFLDPVEGSEDSTQLSLPFVGYYGDFDNHRILDVTLLEGEHAHSGICAPVSFDSYMEMMMNDDYKCNVVGYNPLSTYSDSLYYHNVPEEYILVSSRINPAFEGKEDALKVLDRSGHTGIYSIGLGVYKCFSQYQIRIYNRDTDETYYESKAEGWYEKGGGQLGSNGWNKYPVGWAADDKEGNPLPDGTRVMMDITVSANGENFDSVSIPLSIDNTMPYIEGDEQSDDSTVHATGKAQLAETASGKKYLYINAGDNNYLAAIQIGTMIENVTYSTAEDTENEAVEDVRYSVLKLNNDLYGNKTDRYTKTFDPSEAGEIQHAVFDVTAYNTDEYCISLCDYAGNRTFYKVTPEEKTEFGIRLDPEEVTVIQEGGFTRTSFRVLDLNGYEVDPKSLNWTLSGNSSMMSSLISGTTVMITMLEKSDELILKVSDPDDPTISAEALIHIRRPSVKLDVNELTMISGETYELSAETIPADKEVTWSSSDENVVTVDENGKLTAVSPGKAEITVSASDTLKDTCTVTVLFKDVTNPDDYYFNPVYWAYENGITVGHGGPGKFSPYAGCTREQIVTFLWRLNGEPEPEGTSSFTDVKERDWFCKPITWAAENEITVGLNDGSGRFGVGQTCTREQCVTFLYRAAEKPEVGEHLEFTDVKEGRYFYDAVSWAASKGITVGLNDGTGRFGVGQTCTRAMIVTFLSRYASE